MAKYGFINNFEELKTLQNKSLEEVFIGINKNGFAYFFDGKKTIKINKDQLKLVLELTTEQIDKVLRSRGSFQFDFSKDSSVENLTVNSVNESRKSENLLRRQAVVTRNMDTPGGKEKSLVTDAEVDQSEVNFSFDDSLDAISLEKSNSRTISLKNRIKELSRRVEWLEKNTVTKEQMIQIVQSLTKGE